MSINRAELNAFLVEENRVGRLATVSTDGAPHVVPVWFRVDGERILVHSMRTSRKVADVEATGRFSLAVDRDVHPYRGVSIDGRARLATGEEIDWDRLIRDLAADYCPPEMAPGFGEYLAGREGEHVTIVLEPESWEHWDYA